MRKVLLCLAVLAALTCTAAAYEVPTDFTDLTLEQAMEDFRTYYQLSEDNFSLSYYNTVTGEEYIYNDEKFSIAASTYKLPLNMYFYEMEQAGEITGDTIISWTGRTLDDIHEQSIVNSNNELSEALMYYWNDHTTYKENMRKYFTMTDEEIDPVYYQGNYYCVRMMMDCLKYLYAHSEEFEELIGYMKIAMPGQYFQSGVTEYEVAHKYGSVQWFNNDVGIIYTPQPFLLAVYNQGGNIGGDGVCARAAKLLAAYTVWQGEHTPVEPEEPEEAETVVVEMTVEDVEMTESATAVEKEAPAEPAEEPVPEEVTPVSAPVQTEEPSGNRDVFPWWIAGICALVILLALLRLLRRKRN